MASTPNIGAELQQLPLGYLLGAPLKATIEAQALAAKTTVDFIYNVGLNDDGSGDYTLRTADFSFKQIVPNPAEPGSTDEYDSVLTVPLLSIVPIPYIRVSELDVSFEFKIRDVQTASSSFKTTGSTGFDSTVEAQGKWGGGFLSFLGGPSGSVDAKTHVSISASVTYQSTNRQETDRSATFKMELKAVQDALPEGLSRVLNILNDTITAKKQ